MDKQQARNIIRETFENSFDKSVFTGFIKNLLNRIDDASFIYRGNYIPDAYEQYIKTLERIGKFSDGENKIDILVITLQKETSLERARTMQRNFIAWYLNGSRGGEMKDAALVAFVSPDEADWRFSLVKMDYKFEQSKSGRMKVEEEFTPARRWSFLVGENEKSHTAQSRLVNILKNDEHNTTLGEIEKAFDIETVTKEFFLKYRELFLRTKEELDRVVKKDPKIKADFEEKDVDTINFAKKLLGQIVFLYFLQKKGWFGVGRDDDWGTGSKHFLRGLFKKKNGDYHNFFNDILEPLFYEALRIDRSYDDDYYSRFDCKIPFLNGGLFDPIGNYDWVHTDIILPDKLFSNTVKTREGDIGDGILDVFDRYNFTVKEDEPLEKEVAIDPELLGKAYEKFNAIRPDNFEEYKKTLKSGKKGEENKFNKKFGVYYTPREIVHYMCQQSLINYLHTELNSGIVSYENLTESQLDMLGNEAKEEQLDLTIEHGSNTGISKENVETLLHFGEQVGENDARVQNTGRETRTYSYKLPESIRKNAALIDEKLANITVCDPAVGSGAFPLGMMSEIVGARNVLSKFIQGEKWTPYDFKRRCIENSLYGVDIDPGAVEIAKLRLWLSLVVDEDDIKNIKPLPNLDYKIVCGNSLLGVEKDLFNLQLFNELEELKPLFFNETNPTKKQDYKTQIDDLIYQITNGHKEFDFEVYFSEVFHQKGGFDVVIANPPWVQSKFMSNSDKDRFRKIYTTAVGQFDLFNLFIEKANTLCKDQGVVSFITPDRFINNIDYKKIRKYLLDETAMQQIIALGDGVFENVCMPSAILIFKKSIIKNNEVLVSPFFYGKYYAIKQSDFKFNKRNIFTIYKNTESVSIINKINQKSIEFGEIVNNARGVEIGKKSKILSQTEKSGFAPFLRGEDISKYVIKNQVYIDTSCPDVDYKDKSLYKGRKILIRKTGTGINATIDEEDRYVIQVIYIFKVKTNKNYDEKFLIALLNSQLMEFWYFSIFGDRERKTFPHLTQGKILDFPILHSTRTEQEPFIAIVGKIISLTQSDGYPQNQTKRAQVKVYEKQIDQMVYELCNLTLEEIKIVEGENENAD